MLRPGAQIGRVAMQKRGILKPFSSPGGKEAWRSLILARLPDHDVYVEPYAGSATIFFAKAERAKVEVLADVNPDIVATYVWLRDAPAADFTWMREQSFEWSPTTFNRLKSNANAPKTKREKVYRYKYLNLFSVRGAGDKLSATENARRSTGKAFLRNLEKFQERLQGVKVFEADALTIMAKFDSPSTFFYLDPPWKPVGVGIGWEPFDGDAFAAATKALKGKAMVSYQGAIDLGETFSKLTITSALGGVGTASEQNLLINFDPPDVEKSLHQDPAGGHGHEVDRSALSTGRRDYTTDPPGFEPGEPSGPHSHIFAIGGMLVETECDGQHAHTLPTEDSDLTSEDGEHSHRIPTAEGPIETSAEGSAHTHTLSVDQVSWDSGQHRHTVEVEGQTYTSLMPGEFWALFIKPTKEEPASNVEQGSDAATKAKKKPYHAAEGVYPEKRDPVAGAFHQHFIGDDHFIAFRAKFNDRAIGWRLATARQPANKSIAGNTTPFGDRYSRGFVDSHVLAAKAAPKVGESVRLDRVAVEYGIQGANIHEFFLSKGERFSGVLRFECEATSRGDVWTATLDKIAKPFVLSTEAVEAEIMPPDGFSALPLTIEKYVPPEFRYWRWKGEESRVARDLLVASGLITEAHLVDGVFRLVETKRFVTPYPEFKTHTLKAEQSAPAIKMAASLIAWSRDAKPLLIEAKVANEIGPDDLAAKLVKVDRDYLVEWPDSESARLALSDLGRPFRFKRAAFGSIFVASRAVKNVELIEFVDRFDVVEEVDKIIAAPLSKRVAEIYDAIAKREIPIYATKNESEEMFALGVVLAPDVVDLQNDVYTADEIRKAAHGFMEHHGNRGLMHRELVNDKVVILESYLAPADFTLTDPMGKTRTVKAGTWLLGYGFRDAELWKSVKSGKLRGLSIGGSAVRRPRAA